MKHTPRKISTHQTKTKSKWASTTTVGKSKELNIMLIKGAAIEPARPPYIGRFTTKVNVKFTGEDHRVRWNVLLCNF